MRKCCVPPLFLKGGGRRESGVTSILCNKISAQAEFISAEQVKLKFRVPKKFKGFYPPQVRRHKRFAEGKTLAQGRFTRPEHVK